LQTDGEGKSAGYPGLALAYIIENSNNSVTLFPLYLITMPVSK